MHIITTGLGALFFLSASSNLLAAQEALEAAAAARLHAAQTDELCNYCGDYSDAFVGSGRKTTVYIIGIGYPGLK